MYSTKSAQVSVAEPMLAVLRHIEKQGSLLRLLPDHTQRWGLMKLMSEQKLIVWNNKAKKYELTATGHQHLEQYRSANRQSDAASP